MIVRIEYKFYFFFRDMPEIKFAATFWTKEDGIAFVNENKAVIEKIRRKIYED